MKTLQELYKEVIGSEKLKKEFMEASKDEKNAQKNVEEFLKNNGCDATFEELKAFFEEKSDGELDEDEVEAVAGGKAGPLDLETEDPFKNIRGAIHLTSVISTGCVKF